MKRQFLTAIIMAPKPFRISARTAIHGQELPALARS